MVSNKAPVEDTSLVLASNPMSWRWQPGVSSEKWILRLTSHFQVKLLEMKPPIMGAEEGAIPLMAPIMAIVFASILPP